MTQEEIQLIADMVAAVLKKDSVTIDQLQPTNALVGTDLLELDKGRNVTLDDLRKFIRGTGIFLELIGRDDKETIPTDSNVFSALRTLYEINKNTETLKGIFLRKDQEDQTEFIIRFLAGIIVKGLLVADNVQSPGFTSGMLGNGFVVKKDPDGRAYVETDDLLVRRRAMFAVLEILKQQYIKGDIIQGPGGGTCRGVEEFDTYYRCYLLADDGEKAVENTFDVDDQVRCQEFNIKPGVHENVSNQYYWRKCIAVGDDYIDLSKTDCDKGSMAPKAGDDMATMGNRTNPDRQSATVYGVYGNDAPYIKQYVGINSYDLTGKEKTVISPNGNKFTGKFYFSSGEDVENVFKENISYVKALEEELNAVKNQLDGNITTWFLDPVPTLQNEPYISWKDDAERDMHLKDLYFDKTGRVYRFEKQGGVYQWLIVEDEQLAKALADAKRAQDTADGKRRVFVRQPTFAEPYDEGDLWVNANYSDESVTYTDEMLRCVTAKPANSSFAISHWKKAASYTGDENLNKFINDTFKNSIDDLKNQVDGKIDMYYQQGNPWQTWPSGTEKNHVGDLWYNTTDKVLKRYNGTDGSNTWEPIEDAAAIAAAEAASKAQDTADGKRRVFVSQPYPPYDEGDLWVNATYGSTYKDELLRCNTGIHRTSGSFSVNEWSRASDYTTESSVKARFQATNEKIEGVVTSVSTINGTLTEQDTRITQTEKDITAAVNKVESFGTTVNKHSTLIQQNADAIKTKAEQSSVDTLSGKVNKQATSIEQNANAIKTKASQSSVDSLNRTVSNHTTSIEQNANAIRLKASQSSVDTLSGRVTENTSAIEQNANAIKLKVSQEDLENATKNMAGINLLPAEEDAWEWGYFSPGASSGSAWGEMTTDVQSSIRTKGLVYIGLGSAHLYAKAHMSGYSFSIAQFDEDGKYCGNTSSTAWNRELKFTTDSSCRYIAVSIKKDSGSIYTFHAYYAQIKIELGDVPTAFTPCTNKDVNAGLLSTGIDILNKKIILTADQTLIQSNTGQVIVFFGSDSEGGIKLNSDVYVTFIKAVKGSIGGFTITNGSITSGSGDSLVSLSPSGLKIGTSGGSFFAGAGGIGFTGKPRIGLDGGCITAFKMLVSRTTQSSILDLEDPNYNGFFVNGRPRNGTTDNIVIPMRKRAVAGYRFLVQIIDYSGTCTLDTGGYYDSGGGWHSGNIQIRDRKAREFVYDGQRWHEYFCSN